MRKAKEQHSTYHSRAGAFGHRVDAHRQGRVAVDGPFAIRLPTSRARGHRRPRLCG